jgi:hypothetical protein
VSEGLLLRNARDRAKHGCVTTWQNADGRTLSLYREGSPRKGIASAINTALALDPSFRLLHPSAHTEFSAKWDRGGGERETHKWRSRS